MPELRALEYIVDDFFAVSEAVAATALRMPDLVILAAAASSEHRSLVAEVRAQPAPLGSVPLLGWSAQPLDAEALRDSGLDAMLSDHGDRATRVAEIMAWNPAGTMAGVARLATVFGTTEIDALVTRFETHLAAALATLDHPADPAAAHRIAGIAGTLGFDRVGQSWLALSEGDDTVRDAARRHARVALHAIACARLAVPLY